MKRSTTVPLLVIGTLVLAAGCSRDTQEVKQNSYANRADCEKDWGNDPRNCSQGTGSHSGGAYFGPRYYWDRSIGHPVAVEPSGETRVLSGSYLNRGVPSTAKSSTTSSVSRGGFGSTSHGFSSGGG